MTTNDIDAIRAKWLIQCGLCDAGLLTECTCPKGDVRSVLAALCDEIEQLRAELDQMRALTEGQYLIWSHKQGAWWGPGGHGYRWDVSRAGRFPLDRATDLASTRSWPASQKTPPEVVIPAPPMRVLADSERIDEWINEQVKQATEQKVADRLAERARTQETHQ